MEMDEKKVPKNQVNKDEMEKKIRREIKLFEGKDFHMS